MNSFTFLVKDHRDLKSFEKELASLPYYMFVSERQEICKLRVRILVRNCDLAYAKFLCIGRGVKD